MDYTPEQLSWIDEEMKKLNVKDYRFFIGSNKYVCDEYGNIYSLYLSNNMSIFFKVRKLRQFISATGYFCIDLKINGKKKRYYAHRLIANAWYGDNPSLVVNHKDGNKTNNRLENLEFCTQSENVRHGIRLGKRYVNSELAIYAYIFQKYYGIKKIKYVKY